MSDDKPADHPGAASIIREVKVWLVMPCFIGMRNKDAGHPHLKHVSRKSWSIFTFKVGFPAIKWWFIVRSQELNQAVINEVKSQVVIPYSSLVRDVISFFIVIMPLLFLP